MIKLESSVCIDAPAEQVWDEYLVEHGEPARVPHAKLARAPASC